MTAGTARLKELGLVLPVLPRPLANYLPYRLAGNLLFLCRPRPARRERNIADRQARSAEI